VGADLTSCSHFNPIICDGFITRGRVVAESKSCGNGRMATGTGGGTAGSALFHGPTPRRSVSDGRLLSTGVKTGFESYSDVRAALF